MAKALGPGAIGVRGRPLPAALALARAAGFAALVIDLGREPSLPLPTTCR